MLRRSISATDAAPTPQARLRRLISATSASRCRSDRVLESRTPAILRVFGPDQDRRRDDRGAQGAHADLVDPDDQAPAGLPQAPLGAQVRDSVLAPSHASGSPSRCSLGGASAARSDPCHGHRSPRGRDRPAARSSTSRTRPPLEYLAEPRCGARPSTPAADERRRRASGGPLPETGIGALAALSRLAHRRAGRRQPDQRAAHVPLRDRRRDPAALAADWLTSAIDQNAFSWVNSPLASRLEQLSHRLAQGPVRAAGGLGRRPDHGRHDGQLHAPSPRPALVGRADTASTSRSRASAALPHRITVLTQRLYPHQRRQGARDAGHRPRQRSAASRPTASGRLDLAALEAALRGARRRARRSWPPTRATWTPGAFDPIEPMADLAERYGAWLHVDGAFGLFARRVAGVSAASCDGIERAHSVIADGHKWLNVPYDCGFAFVRDPQLLAGTFAAGAAYLPPLGRPAARTSATRARDVPAGARRCRSGRRSRPTAAQGYRAMVERHLALAQRLAAQVDAAADLERSRRCPWTSSASAIRPDGVDEAALDALNRELGAQVLEDGRVYVGHDASIDGMVCFRPAIVNWLTTEADVDLLVDGHPGAGRQR